MKVFLFNPYTGKPRHPHDIQTDPEGLLIIEPGAPLIAAAKHPVITTEWVLTTERYPSIIEPVVYARERLMDKVAVGIAYWTVSKRWRPEAQSTMAPEGFTHWLALPPLPPLR